MDINHEQIIKLAKQGYAVKEIKEITGIKSATTIYSHLKKDGVVPVKKYPENSHYKEKCKNVIDLYNKGYTQKEIAKIIGTSRDYIGQICRENGVIPRSNKSDPYDYVKKHAPEWSYVSDWSDSDGYATIKSNSCGHEITFSMKSLRCYSPKCPICREQENKLLKEQKIQALIQAKEEKDFELKRSKWVKMSFTQSAYKICPICNSVFYGNNKYCSDICRDQNKWKMKDGYRYQFPLDEVFLKDNGVCYLCGEKCDWNDFYINSDGIKVYGNNYPSRDHVIPKSKGGKNEWTNIRLAHRICNSIKQAK